MNCALCIPYADPPSRNQWKKVDFAEYSFSPYHIVPVEYQPFITVKVESYIEKEKLLTIPPPVLHQNSESVDEVYEAQNLATKEPPFQVAKSPASRPTKRKKPLSSLGDIAMANSQSQVSRDDLFFFANYVQHMVKLYSTKQMQCQPSASEDACFLCKDGGDLVECEYVKRFFLFSLTFTVVTNAVMYHA